MSPLVGGTLCNPHHVPYMPFSAPLNPKLHSHTPNSRLQLPRSSQPGAHGFSISCHADAPLNACSIQRAKNSAATKYTVLFLVHALLINCETLQLSLIDHNIYPSYAPLRWILELSCDSRFETPLGRSFSYVTSLHRAMQGGQEKKEGAATPGKVWEPMRFNGRSVHRQHYDARETSSRAIEIVAVHRIANGSSEPSSSFGVILSSRTHRPPRPRAPVMSTMPMPIIEEHMHEADAFVQAVITNGESRALR